MSPREGRIALVKGPVAIRVTTLLGDTATVRVLRPGDSLDDLRSRQLLGNTLWVSRRLRNRDRWKPTMAHHRETLPDVSQGRFQ